jgi:hypothetical protein
MISAPFFKSKQHQEEQKMKRVFLAVAAMLSATVSMSAQTVSPVIVQTAIKTGSVVQGSFWIHNEGMIPLNVSIEPKSFSADENGKPSFRSLDPAIHVRLSEMSGRVGPKSSREFSYAIQCEQLPCWLSIYSTMVVGHTDQGVAVAIHLPHTIYLTDKNNALRKADVSVVWTSATEAVIENKSTAYDRVQVVKVKGKSDIAGFPLFPSSRRIIHFDQSPGDIAVIFSKFKMESRP